MTVVDNMGKKLEYLQITRGIAALIVVLHHITGSASFYLNFKLLGGIFEAGWNGVDFFFVLSGFIIYYIHSDDIGHPDRLKKFIYKRFIRIYPIYWIIAIIALILIIVANKHVSNFQGLEPLYLIKSFFLIPQIKEPFLRVAWSLCCEVFFYLIFALGIFAGIRAILFILTVYFILLGYQVFFHVSGYNNFYFNFLSSNFHLEFLIGVLTSICYKRLVKKDILITRKVAINSFFILGVILFLTSWICSLTFPLVFGKLTIYSRIFYGISSGIIILGAAMKKFHKKDLIADFFLLLGDASYVLYLVHYIVLAIFFKLIIQMHYKGTLYYYEICLLSFILSVAVGILLHVFLERKILAILNKRLLKK